EILDRAQGTLGAMDLLVEHSAQTRGVQAEASRLRTDIGRQVEGGIAVEIGMTIQAGHPKALLLHLAVFSRVELFLREGGQQYSEFIHMNQRDNVVHDFVEVSDRQQYVSRNVLQEGVSGQEDGRLKLRRQMIRQVKVNIKAAHLTFLLLSDLL